jgi:hypothetical protein
VRKDCHQVWDIYAVRLVSGVLRNRELPIADPNSYSWNPAVGDDCSSLQLGVYVCVGIPGTATAKPTTTSGTSNSGPSPTQTGIASDCEQTHLLPLSRVVGTDRSAGTSYYKVVSGDSCQKIVDKYRTFTLDNL